MRPCLHTQFALRPIPWLVTLALLAPPALVQAACVDQMDGSHVCSGDSDNIGTSLGRVIMDNSAAPASLSNQSDDPYAVGNIAHSIASVEQTATVTANGSQAVTINNLGSNIILDGSARDFSPTAWSTDSAGLLYNNGVLAGYAAAIAAGSSMASLTVNNLPIANGVFYQDFFQIGLPARVEAYGSFTAAIYANNPTLTVDNRGMMSDIVSFAGASYSAPALQDGTQYASGITAGTTIINNSFLPDMGAYLGNIYVVDRNPLLDAAKEQDPSLVIAYSATDVGPRNSIINNDINSINNIYLGSGRHVINNNGGTIYGSIYVDQRDSEVIDVTGGVATTLYKVHGERDFTLNQDFRLGGSHYGTVNINDVAGANNTINILLSSGYFSNVFTANGLGNNHFNLHCSNLAIGLNLYPCTLAADIQGFSGITLSGTSISIAGNYTVSGDFTLAAAYNYLYGISTLTADNVIVSPGSILSPGGNETSINQEIGTIVGNLVNHGSVIVGDATLNVSGDVLMHSGSQLTVAVGPQVTGALLSGGTTTFAPGSQLNTLIRPGGFVMNGDSHLVANNINGLPNINSGTGFVQWQADTSSGDLILNALVGVPDFIKGEVSEAGRNAVEALFSSPSRTLSSVRLYQQLQTLSGEDVVRAAERLRPEINDGATRMVLNSGDRVFGVIDNRLLDTYMASKLPAGMQATDMPPPGGGLWVQGFGDRGEQERFQGVDGYSASSAGMAAGMDKALDSAGNLRAGFAFGYARSNASNTGHTVNNRIDIDSYMLAGYFSHNWDDWYLNAMLGAGRNAYSSRRQLLQHAATSQHDGWQLGARVTVGRPWLASERLALIPTASLDYRYIKENGYEERGKTSVVVNPYVNGVPEFALVDSPINLQVASRDFNSFRAGLGGKMIYAIEQAAWSAELELRALARHEFGDMAPDSWARFLSGGEKFSSPGIRPARNSLQFGGSLRVYGTDEQDQITLQTSYDADLREDYFGQIVSLNLRYDFDQSKRYTKLATMRRTAAKEAAIPIQHVKATEAEIAAINTAIQASADLGETQSSADTQSQQAIKATLERWAAALSNKNTDAYFSSYAADFDVPNGITRQQWERKRMAEIPKESTSIKLSQLRIQPHGNEAVVLFVQTQSIGNQDEVIQKVIDFKEKNGRWLITREDAISLEN